MSPTILFGSLYDLKISKKFQIKKCWAIQNRCRKMSQTTTTKNQRMWINNWSKRKIISTTHFGRENNEWVPIMSVNSVFTVIIW